MGFWGVEVKPGTPHRHLSGDLAGKLHVTQATLGSGSGKEKSVLQCSIGDGSPIYLCSLLPNKNECCPLNLEFDEDDNAVSFSVVGQQSIHLSGYIKRDVQDYIRDEDDSYGIDIAETDSDASSDYDSEEDYEDDFIDDDDDDHLMYPPSSAPNSGVVIEEIVDEEEPFKESQPKRSKKKNQSSEDKNTNKQIVAKGSAQAPDLESEDEDGFPISKAEAGEPVDKTDEMMKGIDSSNQVSDKKRKAKTTEQDGVLESENKKKKKKKQKEKQRGENANGSNKEADEQPQKENMPEKEERPEINQISSDQNENGAVNNVMDMDKNGNSETADKKKKKKKKNKNQEAEVAKDKIASSNGDKEKSDSASEGKQAHSKSSHVRTYPNGLIVEELAMGKPDGKRASPGKQVSVRYIGKLQKNGKIFDSNIGKAPLKFRLGLGQVIKGWDIGVNGMRVGDKRKLTIPPSMGYGQSGAGGKIPPNAWLVFDVELIDVR